MIASLKKAEQRTYRLVHADGLIDMFIGLIVGSFALIPLINDWMQDDFWSSFIILPVYFLAFYGYRWVKRNITFPRIGVIRYSMQRKGRVFFILLTLCVLLSFSVIVGALFFFGQPGNAWKAILFLSGILFLGFTLASFLLDLPRLTIYGILCAAAGPLGEWLWQEYGVVHHGIPLTYGITALFMLLIGAGLLVRFMRRFQVAQEKPYGSQ